MAKANVQVLNEFISAIRHISVSRPLVDQFVFSAKDFTRKRKLGFDDVTFLILSMLKKSLNVERWAVRRLLKDVLPEKFTRSALCQQRQKIDSRFFHMLLRYQSSLFYEFGAVKRYKGYKVLAMDGSSAMLVNSPEIKQYYHGGSNQYGIYSLGRYMKLFDVLNGITLNTILMPFQQGERPVAYHWAEDLPADAITLFDRGFPSYTLMFLLNSFEQARPFVMRCKTGFNHAVKAFAESRQKEAILTFYPDDRAIAALYGYGMKVSRKTALKVRAVKVALKDGSVQIILTNLMDDKKFPRQELKKLYGMRWSIETAIGLQKNLFQLEIFSAHGINEVEQDFYANFIIANIHCLVRVTADNNIWKQTLFRKYRYATNKSASLAVFKANLILLYYTSAIEKLLDDLAEGFEEFTEPIRPGRTNARLRKSRKRYGKHETQKNYRNNL